MQSSPRHFQPFICSVMIMPGCTFTHKSLTTAVCLGLKKSVATASQSGIIVLSI
ncbi:MAG: hypothetical protein ABIF10_00815 [Candidatus Woesearchaeota archaeon]